MTVLLIAEHNNRNLKPATAQVVTAALEMGGPVDVLVLGNDCRSIAEEAAKIAGVRTAYFADNPQFAQESPEAIAEIVVREGKGYDHILFVTGISTPRSFTRGLASMPSEAKSICSTGFLRARAIEGSVT